MRWLKNTRNMSAMYARVRAALQVCKEADVVAIKSFAQQSGGTWLRRLAALLGGVIAASGARAVDLPEDTAEALIHVYDGGGVTAAGPAFLVRKRLADKVSLNASYYVDAVSNASIDVITTASSYRETRNELGVGADYVYRDSKVSINAATSREPDYIANRTSIDVSQEVFGGMTTISLGFTRGDDQVSKSNAPEFADTATHWQYRVGVSQILTPRWISSVNFEVLSDDGYLGSPYRIARVFGAAVTERTPRTRSARALKFRLIGDMGKQDALHLGYRYFWDTWDIKASTFDMGYSRHFGEQWIADASLRYHSQSRALFYSDNAEVETAYITRNRQHSTFSSAGLGAKVTYALLKGDRQMDIRLHGAVETSRFKFSDFTDIRTGEAFAYSANVIQFYVSANF
jgi:hypothetical protein